jgi:hypothetical protein
MSLKSKPASSANGKKEPPAPLPASLVKALPVAAQIVRHLSEIVKLLPELSREMAEAKEAGSVPLARAFVVLHRLHSITCSESDSWFKPLRAMFDEYKTQQLPAIFEQEGVTSVPLAEGYRIGVSYTIRASIKPQEKDKAYAWLRGNKLGDIITTTVNASTLSATARTMLEEQNIELPSELFTVANMPNTSVTRT